MGTMSLEECMEEPPTMESWVGGIDLDWEGNQGLWEEFMEEADLEVLPLRIVERGRDRFVYTSEEYLVEAQRLFQLMCW